MDFDDFHRPSDDARFIPGIYNYCDRWCERCTMALRCRSFSMEREELRDRESSDEQNATFWTQIAQHAEEANHDLFDPDDEDPLDVDEEAIEEHMRRRKAAREEARMHPISKNSLSYSTGFDAWLSEAADSIKQREEELERRGQIDEEGMAPHEEAVAMEDAFAVIRWYETFMHVKLMRALQGRDESDELAETYGFPKDSDGSAKIALIGMDRSIGAWATLLDHLPDQAHEIRTFIKRLQQLRTAVECEFPDARSFKRPGFDYIPTAGD